MTDHKHGSVWDDAHAALYLTGADFEDEFGRARTPDEQAAHELFCAAAQLEEADSMSAGPGGEGGEAL